MITDDDIKKLKKTFVTKEELQTSIDRVIKYIDYRLEPLEELRREFKEFKDQILKSIDFLVGGFKRLDEERIVASEQHFRIKSNVEDHEIRITSLEKKVN